MVMVHFMDIVRIIRRQNAVKPEWDIPRNVENIVIIQLL